MLSRINSPSEVRGKRGKKVGFYDYFDHYGVFS